MKPEEIKNLLPNDDRFAVRVSIDVEKPSKPNKSEPKREAVRLIAIGSPRAVSRLIHTLHNLGFAEAGAWSRFMPAQIAGNVMSVMTWHVQIED